MADIVNSLFGVDPAALQQQRAATDFTQAFRFAQLDPLERANLAIYQGSAGLGRAANQLLGGDEQLNRATKVRELSSQFDMTSADGLRQFAQAVAPFAPDVAQQAVRRSDEILTTGLKQAELQTQAIRNIATANKEKLPEIAQLQAYRDQLVAELGPNHPKVQEVNETIKGVAKGRGTNIVLPGEASDKILREKRTGKFLDLEDAAITAADTIQITRDFNNVLGKAFTGTGAGVKLTASQFANALGVNVTGTTESEQLDQLFAALTVGQAKNLKGALSDKDVKFLKEAVGSRGLTKETLQNVVERIERNALIDQRTFDLAQGYTGDMAKININEFRKQAQKDVNDTFEKRKRLQQLRQKAGPQPQ
jgi:hypothetical protein